MADFIYYFFLYYLAISIAILPFIKFGKNIKFVYIFLCIAAILLITLRPDSIADTKNYREVFESIDPTLNYGFSLLSREYLTGFEYGYFYLCVLIKLITNNYRVLFFITGALSITFFALFLRNFYKNTEKHRVFLVFFIPYFGYMYFLVVIRAGLALCIALFALTLVNKKHIPFKILLYLIAFLIHRWSIALLIIELIFRFSKKFCRLFYIIFYLIILFLFFAKTPTMLKIFYKLLDIFDNVFSFFKYGHYLENSDLYKYSISFRGLLFVILGAAPLIFYGIKDKKMENFKAFNIFYIGLLFLALMSNISGASRVYDPFVLFSTFGLAEIADYLIQKRKFKISAPLLLFFIFYTVIMTTFIIRL